MTRFVSDPLNFTGVDLGTRRGQFENSDEEDEEEDSDGDSSGDDDEYEQELAQMSPRQREEFLIQSAMARIERARSQGRTDVRLNQHEIAALERQRKREEKEKKKRATERKKKKDSRVAVPLTQLEPASRKKKMAPASRQGRQEVLSQYPSSGSNLGDDQDQHLAYPPTGYFSPPNASRSRARSGTTSSRAPSRAREERVGGSYDHAPAPTRHVSDSVAGVMPHDDPWDADVALAGSRDSLNPFQFQTDGPKASAMGSPAAAAARRHTLGPSEVAYMSRRRAAGPVTRSRGTNLDDTESEEDSDNDGVDDGDSSLEERETSSDSTRHRIQTRAASRGRAPANMTEAGQEHARSHPPKKNPTKNQSPSKRKPTRGGRRKK
ncbi:hypothetical protein BGZ63DRAFT_420423 [Mariannaea sp. PMI_226]|nr:hypothetical protein BGZ63DRAFT_420423 [Mariannaea sp. PMI_226]